MSFAGWAELFFITLLAFIIIGPKDLPKVLFKLGRIIQRLRGLSNEFIAEFEKIQFLKENEDKNIKRKKKETK
jgi:sec-independent protein translocase protein TatB